ncbi:hypothetical protein J0383_08030 [Flavobacterium endoglycinae]|uniref:DUF3857 domain-containing protein n=1 Tax=Flavobacterium endoglycinae TaxID=2816357 RepID=A0ABX7QJE3_9FLAO|nr:hypothetical protein [Flavobacterium endoglycinae]QSW90748.1 hypothetical protein J0383_08030 [Flavobacterium endoglycinae]
MSAQYFKIKKPEAWTESLDNSKVIEQIQEFNFDRESSDYNYHDYYHILNTTYYTNNTKKSEYTLRAFPLNKITSNSRKSVVNILFDEHQTYTLHQISILRDGKLIDKIADSKIIVSPLSNGTSGRIIFGEFTIQPRLKKYNYNEQKFINITIDNSFPNDVLIVEISRSSLKENNSLKDDSLKYMWVNPDIWYYFSTKTKFTFINDSDKTIVYKKFFFKDEQQNIIESEIKHLEKGEKFVLEKNNILTKDKMRSVSVIRDPKELSFIDFSNNTWLELSNHISLMYAEIEKTFSLSESAPDLLKEINRINNKEEKLQFVIEYVQNQIAYISCEEIMSDYPQSPCETIKKKYGDSKAKSLLLKVLLNHIKVDASVIFINADLQKKMTALRGPSFNYFPYEYFPSIDANLKHFLPSLFIFDQAIVKINYKGTSYFINPTLEDEYGLIENRGDFLFHNYLEIKYGQEELQNKNPTKISYCCKDVKTEFRIKDNRGRLKQTTIYRGYLANEMRRYFKKDKISMINSLRYELVSTFGYERPHEATIKDTTFEILSDNKKENKLIVEFNGTVINPYYQNKRFLLKPSPYLIIDLHKNQIETMDNKFLLFNCFNQKHEISLFTDQKIDLEKFKEVTHTFNHKYFNIMIQEKIYRKGITLHLDYLKKINDIEISKNDLEEYTLAIQPVIDIINNFTL